MEPRYVFRIDLKGNIEGIVTNYVEQSFLAVKAQAARTL
jgi:hypothetical protein